MTERSKQVALTVILGLPLVITVFLAGPFTAPTAAQGASRMLGPQYPPLIDTNGDGQPSPGDSPANPQLSGNTLRMTTLFGCTPSKSEIGLTSQDSSGKFRTARRNITGREESMTMTGFTGGLPNQFTYTERDSRGVRAAGVGQLTDTNGDGRSETLLVSGNINTVVSLVFTADSNYVSIPTSQAQVLGARQGQCGPAVPQIWVPLADTNGDGRGDSIVLDLNGDGIPDPQFYPSPALGGQSVPTVNNLSLSILVALVGGAGVWYLGRRQQGLSGPTFQS